MTCPVWHTALARCKQIKLSRPYVWYGLLARAGGGGIAQASSVPGSDHRLNIKFDPSKLSIPDVTAKTAKWLGVPMLPGTAALSWHFLWLALHLCMQQEDYAMQDCMIYEREAEAWSAFLQLEIHCTH